MNSIASAPGKIVLAGEYAVLWNAPAICMAVNRRAVAAVSGSEDGECHLRTPGFTGADRFRILDAVTRGVRPPYDIELDTSAFMSDGRKTGIGSSAALTVALVAALEDRSDVYAAAMEAHSRLQQGAGDGAHRRAYQYGAVVEHVELGARRQRRFQFLQSGLDAGHYLGGVAVFQGDDQGLGGLLAVPGHRAIAGEVPVRHIGNIAQAPAAIGKVVGVGPWKPLNV